MKLKCVRHLISLSLAVYPAMLSFSDDKGKTWEVNWITNHVRVPDKAAAKNRATARCGNRCADDSAHRRSPRADLGSDSGCRPNDRSHQFCF